MNQQLSLSARPRSLDAMVGQGKIAARIRAHVASGRVIKAWLLVGPTGCGKTTLARILAVSFQCPHQTTFGTPCKACRGSLSALDVYEINAAKLSGIRELESALEGADYGPRTGKYRIYVIDECHRSSGAAQNLILKYLEDTPDTTMFILCSTAPHQILETVQGRCMVYHMKELEIDEITQLVEKLLKRIQSDLPADRLVETLVENGVSLPRHIAQAVEKYVAGGTPKEAADVFGSTSVDTFALTKSVVKGDWAGVAKYLKNSQNSDIRAVRLSCIAYLKKFLLNSDDISERQQIVATGIKTLVDLQNAEDLVISAGLASVLYEVTALFSVYREGPYSEKAGKKNEA